MGYTFLNNKRIKRAACALLAAVLCFSCTCMTFADTKEQLAAQKNSAQQQKNDAQKKLNSAKSSVSKIESERAEAEAEVEEVDQELVALLAALDILEGELSAKKTQVATSQEDYEAAEAEVEEQYNAMKKRIKFMYEQGNAQYMELLIESQSIADAINKADYAEKVYGYDRELLEKYQEARQKAEDLHNQYVYEESELEAMQGEFKEQQVELEETISEKKAVVENFDEKLAAARSEAKKYESEVKEANTKIAKIAAAEKARAEAEAKAKAEAEAKAKKEAEEREKAEKEGQETTGETSTDTDSSQEGEYHEEVASEGSVTGRAIVDYACKFIGNPYVAGGTSLTNGTDCSGFTMSVYSHFGYKIPRNSSAQASYGRSVTYEEAQPGDIMCYAGHVGIYMGNGMIVHASTPATGIKTTIATYRPILSIRRII